MMPEEIESAANEVEKRLLPEYPDGPLGDEMRRLAGEVQERFRNAVLYGTDDPAKVAAIKHRLSREGRDVL